MTNYDVQQKKYTHEELEVIDREIWRYAGNQGVPDEGEEELHQILKEIKEETKDSFDYKVCYVRTPISWEGDMPLLPFKSESQNLANCLRNSTEIVMFAATIGHGFDRFINRYSRLKPTKGLLLQAYGAERVEAVCDRFCTDISLECNPQGLYTTPRFSTGYGDLPLSVQEEFFSILDCNKYAGIYLNQSLLMSPTKSVTAVLGLGKDVRHRDYL